MGTDKINNNYTYLYQIYCNINDRFVSSEINHGGQYPFFFGRGYSDKERVDWITCKTVNGKGKFWKTKEGATKILDTLNHMIPNGFELVICTFSRREQ